MSQPPGPPRRDALLVGALHLALASWYALGRGVTIVHDFGPDPWSWFWQNVPTELLRGRALESLWYLHAQPPLWNALGAVLLKLFGTAHLTALHGLHVLLGAATAAMCADLGARLTGSRRWGIAAGLLVALHPALLLYEAYALYTTLIAFGIVLASRLLHEAGVRSSPGWAAAFLACVAALVLTRSLFHLLLFVPLLPLALAVGGRPPRRIAWLLVLLVMMPAGWYAKNAAQYGFFGGSSWYGMGLWRTALFRQEAAELRRLFEDGRLEPVVQETPFTPPSAYVRLGFADSSAIPLLSRDDLHNVNVPAISASYHRSAIALIRHAPGRYLRNVLLAYGNFSAPSTDFDHLAPNRARLGLHAEVYRWLTLRAPTAFLEQRTGFYFGSVWFLLVPVTLLAWGLGFRTRAAEAGFVPALRSDAALAFLALLVAYTALVGCAMELGENVRFKFLVEPALLLLLTVVLRRSVHREAFAERS